MVARLSNFKVTNRRWPAAGQPITKDPPNPQPLPEKRETDLWSVLQRMNGKGAALSTMVETLDLEEVEPAKPMPEQSASYERLKAIALKAFVSNCSYTHREAINQVCEQTGVSVERATNGLALMIEQGLLSRTTGDIYYLSESTPF